MLILSRFIALALMMFAMAIASIAGFQTCLLYTSPSPRD